MAKTSSVEKNKRRMKMAKQFANKRAKLKSIAKDPSVSPEDQFAARLKLAELPRNSSKTRIRNRPDPRHGEVELVRRTARWL